MTPSAGTEEDAATIAEEGEAAIKEEEDPAASGAAEEARSRLAAYSVALRLHRDAAGIHLMKLGHIPLVGGLGLSSLPSLSVTPSDVQCAAVARRGEELRHGFAPEGEVERPVIAAVELDIWRRECTEPVALASVPIGDFGHPGHTLPLPHVVVLAVRCHRRWEVGRA
jgi:hypothetical protein